jgi:hypothetical protein
MLFRPSCQISKLPGPTLQVSSITHCGILRRYVPGYKNRHAPSLLSITSIPSPPIISAPLAPSPRRLSPLVFINREHDPISSLCRSKAYLIPTSSTRWLTDHDQLSLLRTLVNSYGPQRCRCTTPLSWRDVAETSGKRKRAEIQIYENEEYRKKLMTWAADTLWRSSGMRFEVDATVV